jgi:hypothetical protein
VPAITDALQSASDTYLARAANAAPGSLAQHVAMEQFGRMDAAISGAAALALQTYNAQIQANNQSRQDFADLVGSLVGKVVTAPDIPGVGNPVDKVSKAIAGKIFDILTTNPDEPAIEMATELHGQYQTRVDGLRQKINQPDLLEEFITGYNELADLQQKLRVDIGAQVAQPGGN